MRGRRWQSVLLPCENELLVGRESCFQFQLQRGFELLHVLRVFHSYSKGRSSRALFGMSNGDVTFWELEGGVSEQQCNGP